MLRAIKVRLYPNIEQELYINQLLGCYRKVYNLALSFKKEQHENHKISCNLKELGHEFHQVWSKSPDLYYLNAHNSKVLKQSIINMLDAYKRFFGGSGYPKFKSKHGNQTCRFPVDAISKRNDYQSKRLTFTSQLKDIRFECSDKYRNYLTKNKAGIKSATLSKNKAGEYYMSILVDGDLIHKLNQPKNDIIGLDMGIKDFIVTSNNERFENIKSIRNNEKKLKKLNQNLSRKQKGGKNRNKARLKLALFHQKLNNIKENYLHHIANQLLDENQIIVIENLNVQGMIKNHCLAKSIQELSLYRFKSILKYKALWYGREVIEIDRFYPSSKLCSCCGFKNDGLTLKDRTWQCPVCQTHHDRDYNAAKNIRDEGMRIILDRHPLCRIEAFGEVAIATSLN